LRLGSSKAFSECLGPTIEESSTGPRRKGRLHLEVDLPPVVKAGPNVEHDALVGREVPWDFRIRDDQVQNGSCIDENGLNHVAQQVLVAKRQELEGEV
jgi:hypothetical protein